MNQNRYTLTPEELKPAEKFAKDCENHSLPLTSEQITQLPRIESYEEFGRELRLLNGFIDGIETSNSKGESDAFDAEFWLHYRKYIETIWSEKYIPILGGKEEDRYPSPVKDYVFSGGTRCFTSQEHFALIKRRTALNAIKKDLGLDQKTIDLIRRCQPVYNRLDPRYGPQKISSVAIEEYQRQLDANRELLAQHPDFKKIEDYDKELQLYDRVYHAVRSVFMYYGISARGEEILERHNNEWTEPMLREMADCIKNEFSIENRKGGLEFISSADLDFLRSHEEKVRDVIAGACECAFVYNASKNVESVIQDRNGYSSVTLGIKPVHENELEQLIHCIQ